MKIFDRSMNIMNREGLEDATMETVETLDNMLNEYNIDHAFMYTYAEIQERLEQKEGVNEYCATLLYDSDDEIIVETIFILWAKAHRNATDERILKAMSRIVESHIAA